MSPPTSFINSLPLHCSVHEDGPLGTRRPVLGCRPAANLVLLYKFPPGGCSTFPGSCQESTLPLVPKKIPGNISATSYVFVSPCRV